MYGTPSNTGGVLPGRKFWINLSASSSTTPPTTRLKTGLSDQASCISCNCQGWWVNQSLELARYLREIQLHSVEEASVCVFSRVGLKQLDHV